MPAVVVWTAIVVLARSPSHAAQSLTESLKGGHAIELSAGLLKTGSSTAAVSPAGVTTGVSGRGLLGSLRYAYWVDDAVAVQVNMGLLEADASVSVNGAGTTTESATVVPILFGLKYQLFEFGGSSPLRPYAYGSLGPYLGYAAGVEAGQAVVTESRWEAALGGRLAVGLDMSISRLFTLGFEVGYLAMNDFEVPIGGEKNYSGPEFSLVLGLILGRPSPGGD